MKRLRVVSGVGKTGFKSFHVLPPLSLQPVLTFCITNQRSWWFQLDVLWNLGWLCMVGKHTQAKQLQCQKNTVLCGGSNGILNNLF